MHPLKPIILIILGLTAARYLIPQEKRPWWSLLLAPLALILTIFHFTAISLDTELMPAILLAIGSTIAGIWEWRRPKTASAQRMTAGIVLRTVMKGAALGLFLLSVYATVTLSSDPVIRPIQPLVSTIPTEDTIILADHAYLRGPRDLAFNPLVNGELWIVNERDNSVAIIHDTFGDTPTIEYRRDGKASHFMHRPSALAFGSERTTIGIPGTFATAQESRDDALPFMARNFMGPSLFSSDLDVFAHRVAPHLLGSHLDMLHESPHAMGIAWERDHVYWVFGGYLGNIVRYDFVQDHGVGHDDHSNGIIRHYGRDIVRRVPGVPSHLAIHHPTNTLYIADTGNSRVLSLDMTSGTPAADGPGWESGVDTKWVDDFSLKELIAPGQIALPSGLFLHDDLLYVGDYATGNIHVFDLYGNTRAIFDTNLGQKSLMGLTIGQDEALYFIDNRNNRILRTPVQTVLSNSVATNQSN